MKKLHVLLLALQLVSHGADAYLTNRSEHRFRAHESNPILRQFVGRSSAKNAAAFGGGLASELYAEQWLKWRGRCKFAVGLKIADTAASAQGAVYTAFHSGVLK